MPASTPSTANSIWRLLRGGGVSDQVMYRAAQVHRVARLCLIAIAVILAAYLLVVFFIEVVQPQMPGFATLVLATILGSGFLLSLWSVIKR